MLEFASWLCTDLAKQVERQSWPCACLLQTLVLQCLSTSCGQLAVSSPSKPNVMSEENALLMPGINNDSFYQSENRERDEHCVRGRRYSEGWFKVLRERELSLQWCLRFLSQRWDIPFVMSHSLIPYHFWHLLFLSWYPFHPTVIVSVSSLTPLFKIVVVVVIVVV